ncbi:MAG: hypothetical protein HZA91_04525 [Verrucomicrobia bacterium]|nr:hypothetical protein [Verrucomicrobiota bacterium]
MFEFLSRILNPGDFVAHGNCYGWDGPLIRVHVVSDVLTGLAYMSIPFTMIYLVRRRHDVPFNWLFVAFGVFITACGATHFMEVWNVWHDAYWLAGIIKAITAAASVFTAIALARVFPKLLALQSPEQLERVNRLLQKEVAERKRAEEALARQATDLARSNAELEQFANVVSHDLQEPLQTVTSFTQLLGERYKGRLGADADEFIRFAVDGAKRMQQLIVDLLAYSRAGRPDKPLKAVDAGSAAKQAIENLKAAIEASGAVVACDALPTVMADASQLARLFQNLVGNAVKFHRPGDPPQISIRAEPEGARWRFAVRDNGIGFEAKDGERIFQVFQRLHGREQYPGTGIGLAICKKIIERHGGQIRVESEPGKGSTFYFTLPAKTDAGA